MGWHRVIGAWRPSLFLAGVLLLSGTVAAQAPPAPKAPAASAAAPTVDCLGCHGDPTLESSPGHSIAVDGNVFHSSVHGSLGCADCHTSVKDYPHAANIEPVKCETCHADQASQVGGSVHIKAGDHPCTNCHGDAHKIFPKTDPRSRVYPLNIPKTCANCHGNTAMMKKYGFKNVYSSYMDSIHGAAVNDAGLLVSANCSSCHGSHSILSHNDPKSSTYRVNVPQTCGQCHGRMKTEYFEGVHGQRLSADNIQVPVCTDCHTAHDIMGAKQAGFGLRTTATCGGCHKEELATYRHTFHAQLNMLGGFDVSARCWDCHGAHKVLPSSDPQSTLYKDNRLKTCGKCHSDINERFVQYLSHVDPSDRKQFPQLYWVRMFMNVLLWSVLTFFALHTILWIIRGAIIRGAAERKKTASKGGAKDAR